LDHMTQADVRRTEFPVGTYVLADYHASSHHKGPPNKMMTYLRGPLRVKSSNRNTYTLENLTTKKDEQIHVTDLRAFHYDSNHDDPADIARKDYTSTFVVEEILEHTGDNTTLKSTMEFKTRFQGLDESNDRWLPYSELRDNEIAHAYFTAHDLKDLIPAKFRVKQRKLGNTKKKYKKPKK
jgi:hypothetical protein